MIADILREGIDGAAGLKAGVSNLPDDVDWPSYVTRLRQVAEQFPPGRADGHATESSHS